VKHGRRLPMPILTDGRGGGEAKFDEELCAWFPYNLPSTVRSSQPTPL
jgi:hypothetical protein